MLRRTTKGALGAVMAAALTLGAVAPASADPVDDAEAQLAALNYQLGGSSSLPVEIELPFAEAFPDTADLLGGNVKRCTITGTIRDMGYSKEQWSNNLDIWGNSKIRSDCGQYWIPLIETQVTIWHTPPYGSDNPFSSCDTKGPYTDEGSGAGFGPVFADVEATHSVGVCQGTGSTMYWKFEFRYQGRGKARQEREFCYEQKVFGDGPHPTACPVDSSLAVL